MATIIRSTYGMKPTFEFPTQSLNSSCDEADSLSDDGSLGPKDNIKPTFANIVKPATVESKTSATTAKTVTKLSIADKLTVLTNALAFLPLADIEVARLAGPLFAAAASRVAPKPLGNDDVVFVRWAPQETRVHSRSPANVVFPWRCLSCGNISVGPRTCNACRAPLAVSACRVFLGQIRKDLSAELATAMLGYLAPEVTILHMESHTNGADGRGKGCAWAYVDSVEDAIKVTELHKRVFVDVDVEGGEGFWFVKDAALVPQLTAMAEDIGASRSRPLFLPRQPLVAELPGKSMLASYVALRQ